MGRVRRPLLLLPLLALAACGGSEPAPAPVATTAARAPEVRPPRPPAITPARCAPAATNCTAHTGTVIAIESVDRDGDGDLHVITSGGSVTAPGITVLDVGKDLRPERDPRPGDRVTGAGPVYPGSFKQHQIQVTEFRIARAG